MLNALVYISTLVFLYMLYHTYKCTNEIECLSDIAYDSHKVVFPICMVLIILSLLPGIMVVTSVQFHWVCLIAVISLFGVATLPYKDSKTKYILHYICALLSMISVAVLWLIKGYWFIPILFCVSAMRKKWLLGIEMGLLISMFLYSLI